MQVAATIKNGKAFIDFARLTPAQRESLDTIPSGKDCTHGQSRWFPFTLILFRRLRILFGEVDYRGDVEAATKMKEWAERFELAHRMRDAETLPAIPVERVSAWRHQQRGFWFGYHLPAVMLSEKMGAGKTKQIIDIICARDHKKVIVATTASAVDDWPNHIAKHSTKPYHVLVLGELMRSMNATRKAEVVEWAFAKYEYLIVVVSYDLIWRPPLGSIIGNRAGGGGDIGLLARLGFDCIVADEVHKLASPTGRAGLFVWKLGERIPHRIGATGTVIRHKPENAIPVYRFLDSALLGVDTAAAMERYCVFNRPTDRQIIAEKKRIAKGAPPLPGFEGIDFSAPPGPRFIVNYKRLDELGRMLSTITYHCDDTGLDLPIPIHQTKRCYLSMKAQRAYEQMEGELATTLDDGTEIVSTNKLTAMLRLRQITGGFVGEKIVDPETGETAESEIHEIDHAKENLLEETLSEIDPGESVVVVGVFKHDMEIIRRVAKRCGRKCLEQSGKRKQRIAWQEATGGEVLAAQIQSACEAIDLTRSHYMVFYSIGFSVYQYLQMLARIDRPGQTRRPTYSHLVANNTIDEKMYKAIRRLMALSEEVIAAMKQPIALFTAQEYKAQSAA